MRFVDEDAVLSLTPFSLLPPAQVSRDGDGGVTEATWDRLRETVDVELEVRLQAAGVISTLWRHKLVLHAANLLMSAQICRRMQAYQETANSYFAEANVKLRLFFDKVAKVSEGTQTAQVVVPTATLLDDSALSDSQSRLSVFEGIRL